MFLLHSSYVPLAFLLRSSYVPQMFHSPSSSGRRARGRRKFVRRVAHRRTWVVSASLNKRCHAWPRSRTPSALPCTRPTSCSPRPPHRATSQPSSFCISCAVRCKECRDPGAARGPTREAESASRRTSRARSSKSHAVHFARQLWAFAHPSSLGACRMRVMAEVVDHEQGGRRRSR